MKEIWYSATRATGAALGNERNGMICTKQIS